MKETLAAAVAALAGWPECAGPDGILLDPLCGSGTLLIEAALMARDCAPGIARRRWGFQQWRGHNPALFVRGESGEVIKLSTRGMALGVITDIEIAVNSVDLAPGDVLVFYTDGVTDAINEGEEAFGFGRLAAIVAAQRRQSAEAIIRAVNDAIVQHVGDESRFDDATMIVLRRVQ